MSFMIPTAHYLSASEAEEYRVLCSEDCNPDLTPDFECRTCDADYANVGSRRLAGWYGYLSAPGYLDRTDWSGPYETEKDALNAVCEFYEVDRNGDPLDDSE